jgi:acyl carrier protein
MAATQEQIIDGLAEIINEIAGIPIEDVQLDKSFTDDLDIDTLSMVEVVVAAEERFDVTIPDEDVKHLKTVGDAVDYILEHLTRLRSLVTSASRLRQDQVPRPTATPRADRMCRECHHRRDHLRSCRRVFTRRNIETVRFVNWTTFRCAVKYGFLGSFSPSGIVTSPSENPWRPVARCPADHLALQLSP